MRAPAPLRRTHRPLRLGTVCALVLAAVSTFPMGTSASHLPRFLTPPFPRHWKMAIDTAWWRGQGELHKGMDYVKGDPDQGWTWQSFPVIAAAGGRACAASERSNACITGVGSRVVIRHRREGRTWYTYYGHMATRSISSRIPLNKDAYSVRVKRGEFLGMAGRTGLPGTGLHLHFEVITVPFRAWDPYDLYAYAPRYPDPAGRNGRTCGSHRLWIECPPKAPATTSTALDPAAGGVALLHAQALTPLVQASWPARDVPVPAPRPRMLIRSRPRRLGRSVRHPGQVAASSA